MPPGGYYPGGNGPAVLSCPPAHALWPRMERRREKAQVLPKTFTILVGMGLFYPQGKSHPPTLLLRDPTRLFLTANASFNIPLSKEPWNNPAFRDAWRPRWLLNSICSRWVQFLQFSYNLGIFFCF